MVDLGDIQESARQYARKSGLHLPDTNYQDVSITRRASRALGHAYDAMPEYDPRSLPAYHAMRDETMRQFEHMTKPVSRGGLGLQVNVTQHDPYGSQGPNSIAQEFRNDVMNHGRMNVMSTAATGGHLLGDEANDAFRAVHDVYGHLATGRGIDMHGEEAAFQKHSRMYSPLARRAMATETRGQNGALQLHGEFQEQKIGFLPEHLQGLQFSNTGTTQERVGARIDAAREHLKQGL